MLDYPLCLRNYLPACIPYLIQASILQVCAKAAISVQQVPRQTTRIRAVTEQVLTGLSPITRGRCFCLSLRGPSGGTGSQLASGLMVGWEVKGKNQAAPGQWQFLNLHLPTSARLWKRMSHSWIGSVAIRLGRGV